MNKLQATLLTELELFDDWTMPYEPFLPSVACSVPVEMYSTPVVSAPFFSSASVVNKASRTLVAQTYPQR